MVKFTYLLTALGLFTLSFAKKEECENLEEKLNEITLESCSVDDNGKIISLNLEGETLTQDIIDEVSSYETIQEL
ncbi:hypothetical protein PIROE2DRAFT_17792 [Piromyces sp. E2]|nr:hypothetical protein PIROE2DRAFT_17792 [Piromyces sp. E2]|eukprot:OUM57274.1 hypothetical protein PIROE2DRAFT_17792 [Piromyces sp. E2]